MPRFIAPVGLNCTLLKRGPGVYEVAETPAPEELAGLTEADDYFSAGMTYVIDDATAAALTAAGFGVIDDSDLE